MAFSNSRNVVLLAQTTVTTNGTGPSINVPQGYTGVIVAVQAQTVSGTTPTFDVYLQNQFILAAATDTPPSPPTGTAAWQDLIHFTQITTNSTVMGLWTQNNTNTITAQQDATLTAGTANNGPIGDMWRIKYVVGGTTPSAVLSVTVKLCPEG